MRVARLCSPSSSTMSIVRARRASLVAVVGWLAAASSTFAPAIRRVPWLTQRPIVEGEYAADETNAKIVRASWYREESNCDSDRPEYDAHAKVDADAGIKAGPETRRSAALELEAYLCALAGVAAGAGYAAAAAAGVAIDAICTESKIRRMATQRAERAI